MEGTVKFFLPEKGYGFITDDTTKKDLFFHMKDLHGAEIKKGDRVNYLLQDHPKGPVAKDIDLIN